jgi:hypothetical protein
VATVFVYLISRMKAYHWTPRSLVGLLTAWNVSMQLSTEHARRDQGCLRSFGLAQLLHRLSIN